MVATIADVAKMHFKSLGGGDPLVCPKCTGEMRIISFIYKKEVIKKILIHLNVYEEGNNQHAPPLIKKEEVWPVVEIEPYDDGWSG